MDFILTDPPYLAGYKSRDNRTVLNDDNAAWLARSFAQMYRVLKHDAFAISFYGWPKVDLFFAAWKGAGFRIGGHMIFRKHYVSKSAFLQYRHVGAYLLLKGNPAFPAQPLPDVMDWTYTATSCTRHKNPFISLNQPRAPIAIVVWTAAESRDAIVCSRHWQHAFAVQSGQINREIISG